MQLTEAKTFGSLVQGKVVVVDTSSLLIAGTQLLTKLHDCEVVIPAIVVNELEAKRTHPTLGALARQWINLLEGYRVSHGIGLSKGVTLDGQNNIVLRVEPNHKNQETLPGHLQDGSVDSTILAVARNLELDTNIVKSVVLLSNDIPMRLHATLDLEMEAYEFLSSMLEGTRPYTARATVTLSQEEYIELDLAEQSNLSKLEAILGARLAAEAGAHMLVDVMFEGEVAPVMVIRLENGSAHKVERKITVSHITGRTLEQDVALSYLRRSAEDMPVVSIVGSAGTGKTLLTVATALEAVKKREYQKIVVFRSLHEMGQGQEMGFLPGGVEDKMGPWAGAIGDALDVIATTRKPEKKNEGPSAVEDRKKISEKLAEMIEVSPITYLRGRSLAKSFIILDEAQNFSRTELLNIISRVGEDSKIVMLFDTNQVDNRFLQAGNKADVWSVVRSFKEESIFAHVTLTRTERSKLAELASRMLEE